MKPSKWIIIGVGATVVAMFALLAMPFLASSLWGWLAAILASLAMLTNTAVILILALKDEKY